MGEQARRGHVEREQSPRPSSPAGPRLKPRRGGPPLGFGAFHPLRDRLARWTGTDPVGLVRHVREDLCRHLRGALRDDVAIVALQRAAVPARAGKAGTASAEGTGGAVLRTPGRPVAAQARRLPRRYVKQ
ncbi:hypothetical protein ABZ479_04965 [Streptomyces sp. NPDC005722]